MFCIAVEGRFDRRPTTPKLGERTDKRRRLEGLLEALKGLDAVVAQPRIRFVMIPSFGVTRSLAGEYLVTKRHRHRLGFQQSRKDSGRVKWCGIMLKRGL